MPIRPEMKALYPEDWAAISDWVRFDRAMGRCECEGECGSRHHLGWASYWFSGDARCPNYHREPSRFTGSLVILTTAHLNHDPSDIRPEILRAMCQGCHLSYDRDHHAATRAARKQGGQMTIPEDDQTPAPIVWPTVPAFANSGEAVAWMGIDAARWTAAFLQATDLANAGPDFVHTVHGWFCNAIGAGQSSGNWPGGQDPRVFYERLEGWRASAKTGRDQMKVSFHGPDGQVGVALWVKETGILQYDLLRSWLGQDEHDQPTRLRVARTLFELSMSGSIHITRGWADLDETTQNDWIEQAGIVIRAQRGKCSCVGMPNPEMDEWCPQHGRASA